MPNTNFIRTFAKYFTNLTHAQRKELERALLEIQDSKEITNLETSINLLRRKVDQRLPIPQPISKPTIRGAVIEWEPLTDQRINFYEVDVTTESNFSTFNTFPTYGVSIVIDGLTATNFVRIRGVRRDGTTTPYSETIPVIPNLFDVTAHTDENFYVKINNGDEPTVVLGGEDTDLDYTPINPNGNSKVWGFFSIYGDPHVAMFGLKQIVGQVVVKIKDKDGNTVAEGIEWQATCPEYWSSHAIGPFTVAHPELDQDLELRLEFLDTTFYADGSPRATETEVYWAHLNVLELGI